MRVQVGSTASCSPLRNRIPVTTLTIVLFLQLSSHVAAQPGAQIPFEVFAQQQQDSIDTLSHRLAKNPRDSIALMQRAKIYEALFVRASLQGKPRASYADLGLADVTEAIELTPTAENYSTRAKWHERIWDLEAPKEGSSPSLIVDHYLANTHFDAARADLLNAVRLDKTEANLLAAYLALSDLHRKRAEALAKPAEVKVVQIRGTNYFLWADFDQSIDYAKKALQHLRSQSHDWPGYYRENVRRRYADKGRAALELEDYELALESFVSGATYIDNTSWDFCPFYYSWSEAHARQGKYAESIAVLSKGFDLSPWNCRFLLDQRAAHYIAVGDLQKAVNDYSTRLEHESSAELRIKRAKLYLDLGDPQKALDDLNYAIEHYSSVCPQPFLLRAQAYKSLGNFDLAAADEQTAATLPVGKGTGSKVDCVENRLVWDPAS